MFWKATAVMSFMLSFALISVNIALRTGTGMLIFFPSAVYKVVLLALILGILLWASFVKIFWNNEEEDEY